MSVAAPNPYLSVWVADTTCKLYPRVRGVAWEQSRKASQLEPNEELFVTIDLLPFWDEICGDAVVKVSLQVTDDSGASQDHIVEGHEFLNIPSFEEKFAEMKKRYRHRALPAKLFDVSDSTQFQPVQPR